MNKQFVAATISILLSISCGAAQAAERAPAMNSGFYGGLALRELGVQTSGTALGIPASALSRFAAGPVDDGASRALLYGGYRWANDLAVEASFNSADSYALKPAEANIPRRGLGLLPSTGSLGLGDLQARSWNVDLYTSWSFYRSLALYGRLGYAQTDPAPTLGMLPLTSDNRRLRDGMNYGVGVRYDMTSALGLRVEYGRFGRFAGELGSTPLESDQVTLGLQLRF